MQTTVAGNGFKSRWGMSILNDKELFQRLKVLDVKKIYLIHETYRAWETRRFARKLKNEGFIAMVAQDFRMKGTNEVINAIEKADMAIVVAFDEETVRKAKRLGVEFVEIE